MNNSLGSIIVLGLAAASLWKLAVADRISRVVRYPAVRFFRWIGKHKGFRHIGYHLEYVVGCALCFPFWASLALYWGRHQEWVQFVTAIFAARIVGYFLLRYFNETSQRDWPPPLKFPPAKI